MTEAVPVGDRSASALRHRMKSAQRVQAVNRNMRGMLPIGWGLGDSFGSITLYRTRVKSSSCNILRRPGMGAILS